MWVTTVTILKKMTLFETEGLTTRLNFASIKDVPNVVLGTFFVPTSVLGTSFAEAKFSFDAMKPSVSNDITKKVSNPLYQKYFLW